MSGTVRHSDGDELVSRAAKRAQRSTATRFAEPADNDHSHAAEVDECEAEYHVSTGNNVTLEEVVVILCQGKPCELGGAQSISVEDLGSIA